MSLAQLYQNYLQKLNNQNQAFELAAALEQAGFRLEGNLLKRYFTEGSGPLQLGEESGVWAGYSVWLGPRPPQAFQAGQIWFDTVELVPMLLLPRTDLPDPEFMVDPSILDEMTPFVSWIALRTVANWQYATFLALAPIGKRVVQIEPPFPLLSQARIINGGETNPVTNLTEGEARFYANWFGKGLSDRSDWEVAFEFLPPTNLTALWGLPGKEWAGSLDEDWKVVVTPETFELELDPRDELDNDEEPAPNLRMLYSEWQTPAGVSFRTHVSSQIGLFKDASPTPTSLENIQLLEVFSRPG